MFIYNELIYCTDITKINEIKKTMIKRIWWIIIPTLLFYLHALFTRLFGQRSPVFPHCCKLQSSIPKPFALSRALDTIVSHSSGCMCIDVLGRSTTWVDRVICSLVTMQNHILHALSRSMHASPCWHWIYLAIRQLCSLQAYPFCHHQQRL